jgi:hypothetical protein
MIKDIFPFTAVLLLIFPYYGSAAETESTEPVSTDNAPTISDTLRIDTRHYFEPRHYMKRRDVYIVQMEPEKLAKQASEVAEIFEKQNQFDNACICYQDAIDCFRRSKTPIDQEFESRVVSKYCQLLRKRKDLQQARLLEKEFSGTKEKRKPRGNLSPSAN